MRPLLLGIFLLGGCATGRALLEVAARVPKRTISTTTYILRSEAVTGFTRQCFYAFGSTVQTRTINSTDLCDLSIEVRTP